MAPISADVVGVIPGLLDSGQYQVIFWGLFTFACAFLVMIVFIFLCSSCNRSPDKEDNLLNMPSEKETNSYLVSSRSELPANGHTESLTNGDVLSDQSTIVNSSEDALLPVEPNQDAQCKSSKCTQSRELPEIPGNDPTAAAESTEVNEAKTSQGVCNTYEVLKDSSSPDMVTEDSLYETVKELKEETGSVVNEIYSEAEATDLNVVVQDQNHQPADGTAAYATVSKVKVNRSLSTEQILVTEDEPPPNLIKQLDENIEIAAMYSTVTKSSQQWHQTDTELEAGYACIEEVTASRLPPTPNHLYASVSELEGAPKVPEQNKSVDAGGEDIDPGYEAISGLKETSPEQNVETGGNQSTCLGENDYESICEVNQK
ncbi:phosphoprotein associated with glycosphingolipid-enriched microdomains 1 [Mobula hypostoma]|uniref:phosphoprotein associated with glycosphingolipid-enriched microdomains 1 n=1 Tax=Mobula hypostoma TaxID=723540 RepID=UPI002FC31697